MSTSSSPNPVSPQSCGDLGAAELAARASRLRRRAARIDDPVLAPLVVAMKRRAAELELHVAVLRARSGLVGPAAAA